MGIQFKCAFIKPIRDWKKDIFISYGKKGLTFLSSFNSLCMLTHSFVSNSLWPHGLWPMLCPWDFSGKKTRVGCHFLFQGIFPTQGSNPRLHISCIRKWILYHWATWEVLNSFYFSKILGWGSRNCLCIMVWKGVPFGMGHQGKKVTNTWTF